MSRARHLALLLSIPLCACGTETQRAVVTNDDPIMAEALEGQLLVDPDLSQQNMRNYAVLPSGPADHALPVPDPDPGK